MDAGRGHSAADGVRVEVLTAIDLGGRGEADLTGGFGIRG